MSDPSGLHSADPEKDPPADRQEPVVAVPAEPAPVAEQGAPPAEEPTPQPEVAPAEAPATSDPEAHPDHPEHQSWLKRLEEWLTANPPAQEG